MEAFTFERAPGRHEGSRTESRTRVKYYVPVFALLLPLGQSSTIGTTQDDAAVYDAVIEHTLRAEFQRYEGPTAGARATVWLAGRTIPICGAARDATLGCIEQSDVGMTLTYSRAVERMPPGGLPSAAALAELTADFRSRNGASRELPTLHAEGVRVLTGEELREVQQRLFNGQRASYSSFSLPAYSSDGYAVVHVGYVCGNVCGYWWLILLKKVDSKWQVQGRLLLGIA